MDASVFRFKGTQRFTAWVDGGSVAEVVVDEPWPSHVDLALRGAHVLAPVHGQLEGELRWDPTTQVFRAARFVI